MSFKVSASIEEVSGFLSVKTTGIEKLMRKRRIAARMTSELINDRDNWKGDALAFKERFFNARANFDTLTKDYNALVMKSNKAEKDLNHNYSLFVNKCKEIDYLNGKIAAYEKILKIEK